VDAALAELVKQLVAGTATAVIGPDGSIAFDGWTERSDLTDACAYRVLLERDDWEMKQAIARAETMAGRALNVNAINGGNTQPRRGTYVARRTLIMVEQQPRPKFEPCVRCGHPGLRWFDAMDPVMCAACIVMGADAIEADEGDERIDEPTTFHEPGAGVDNCFARGEDAPREQSWCPHVGGLGPPFPLCSICAGLAEDIRAERALAPGKLVYLDDDPHLCPWGFGSPECGTRDRSTAAATRRSTTAWSAVARRTSAEPRKDGRIAECAGACCADSNHRCGSTAKTCGCSSPW
jgi:hypothetical protein